LHIPLWILCSQVHSFEYMQEVLSILCRRLPKSGSTVKIQSILKFRENTIPKNPVSVAVMNKSLKEYHANIS